MTRARILLLGVLCALTAAAQAATEAIKLGVFPYVTPVQLVKFHNPLRARIEEVLGRPVTLETAPSFKEFIKRTRQGQYDYVLTAPHLGRLAQQRDGYLPLVKTGHVIRGVYLVPKGSPIQTLADLEGKTITMGSPRALICQLAVRQLKDLGLEDGVNLTIRTTRTHNNAMFAPLRGESDASLTGILLFEKTGQARSHEVRMIGQTDGLLGFVFLGGARQSPEDLARVKAALESFGDTPAGQAYMKENGYTGLPAVTDDEMEALQPFIEPFLKQS